MKKSKEKILAKVYEDEDKPDLSILDNKRKAIFYKGIIPSALIAFFFSFAISLITKIVSFEEIGDINTAFETQGLLQIFSLTLVLFAIFTCLIFYISKTRVAVLMESKYFQIIVTAFALTYVVSALFGKFLSIYAMPLSLGGLFIATLVDRKQGVVANAFLCVAFYVIYVIMFGSGMELGATIALISGLVSGTIIILRMDKTYSRLNFVGTAAVVALCMAPVSFITAFLVPGNTMREILFIVVWSVLSVMLSVVIFLPCLAVFEKLFRIASNFRLDEMCSFDAPLLKRLSVEAPGTFSHSISVASLAQLCAIAIGENPQLARAAGYYHDVGKLKDPLCYTENQSGYNPHDDFIPEVSVYMITQHTKWGYDLIKKANLPDEIAQIAKEHHGTSPVNYFYYKVQNFTEGDLQMKDFCYEGPIPSTRISAIVMIVDTVEAAIRAIGIKDEAQLRTDVHKLIDDKRVLGQFDNCDLTLKQLKEIEDTLVQALPGLNHKRISYNIKKK